MILSVADVAGRRGRLVTHSTLGELTAGSAQVVRVRTPRAGELRLALEAEGAHVQPVSSDRLGVGVNGHEHTH